MKIRHILNIAFSHRLNSIFNVADENPSQFDKDMKNIGKTANAPSSNVLDLLIGYSKNYETCRISFKIDKWIFEKETLIFEMKLNEI